MEKYHSIIIDYRQTTFEQKSDISTQNRNKKYIIYKIQKLGTRKINTETEMNNYKETKQPKFWKKDPLSHYAIVIEVNKTDVKNIYPNTSNHKKNGTETTQMDNTIKSKVWSAK